MINFNEVLGFDFETQGNPAEYALQPWRLPAGGAWISAVAFTRGEASQGVLYPKTETLRKVFEPVAEKQIYCVGWNAAFDVSWLIALGLEDLAFQIKWLDAMLLWRHLVVEPEGDDVPKHKRKPYTLEAAVKEFFPDEAGFKEFKNFQTTDPEELKLLLFRCKEDTRFAVRLGELFWNQLTPRQQQAALIEARCIPQVARANFKGIWSSKAHAENLQLKLIKDGDDTRAKLKALCPDLEFIDGSMTAKQLNELRSTNPEANFVNLGSPQQLGTLLFDTWGLPSLKQTKGTDKNPQGNRSTDKNVLYELAFKDPRAKMLKEVREAKNNCTKYATATLKCLEYNGDGYIRPGAFIFSTYSSRMTYASTQKRKADKERKISSEEFQVGVALHQWKRGKEFRRLIRPPEGFSLVELDFAGQEFGWMAVASKDQTMLRLREPGEDAHSYMGAQIAQIEYHDLIRRVGEEDAEAEIQRKLGKFANLSFQYRVGPKKALEKARVDYEMDIDETFIKQILATYKSTYPGVTDYWRDQISRCKMLGYAETFAGRRVQLKGSWTGRDAWAMESSAINYPIQGTGGDQKYLALAVARNLLPKYSGHFYFELHDGLFLIFPHAIAEKAAVEMRHTLSNLPYKQAWGINLPITFPVDAKISSESWGDLMKVK